MFTNVTDVQVERLDDDDDGAINHNCLRKHDEAMTSDGICLNQWRNKVSEGPSRKWFGRSQTVWEIGMEY
jgi:hypothetical protein